MNNLIFSRTKIANFAKQNATNQDKIQTQSNGNTHPMGAAPLSPVSHQRLNWCIKKEKATVCF